MLYIAIDNTFVGYIHMFIYYILYAYMYIRYIYIIYVIFIVTIIRVVYSHINIYFRLYILYIYEKWKNIAFYKSVFLGFTHYFIFFKQDF